ncbi:MAG: sigma-70 family RNA polymerase sigma factor [Anaerolineae bacterium]|nr:sigma-70 family RNA polymerase sigma factor [Anaerolineae bacterium]
MTPENLQDEQLVAQMVSGNTFALEIVYDRYAPSVMGFVLRIVQDHAVAEDVVQETFWRIWKGCTGFRKERGTFSSWMYAIARNTAIDRWRGMKDNPSLSLDQEVGGSSLRETQPDPDEDVAEAVFDTFRHRQVRAAIQALPEEQSEVIELAFFKGLTRQEIAEAMQTPLGTVHTRARLALQKLRMILVDDE